MEDHLQFDRALVVRQCQALDRTGAEGAETALRIRQMASGTVGMPLDKMSPA